MSYTLVFYLGVMLGTLLGVGIMCLLAISKPEKGFSRSDKEYSVPGPSSPGA
jgi:hypothetical protein